MATLEKITNICENIAKQLGYAVVRVQLNSAPHPILQIMIERLDDVGINVDDCARFSRALSVHLDVENPFSERYNLEVSSAGLDRPITKNSDFKRFIGKQIMVKTFIALNKRKQFKGTLESATEENIVLLLDEPLEGDVKSITIAYTDIKQSNIIASL